jgi:hypothetical protein
MIDIKSCEKMYNRMVKLGMPTVLAATIANQADDFGYRSIMRRGTHLSDCIIFFLEWDKTKEGFEFWTTVSEAS